MFEQILHEYLQGQSCEAYRVLGAHFTSEYGQQGVRFTVYAPHAQNVFLIGEFSNWNAWQMTRSPMGFWSIFVEGAQESQMYKYRIQTPDGLFDRADPFGFYAEVRPATASRICQLEGFTWTDEQWMAHRGKNYNSPLSIYEVHPGSWRIKDGQKGIARFFTYDELIDTLLPYVKQEGFTHIELLPLTEHPLDASWGYQVSGYYAATSRYGTPKQLMHFVDCCHREGIGVIMDFVPAHFISDNYALSKFDGFYLYESENPDLRESEWGTVFFDFTKPHVVSFLKSAVDFWLTCYHFDGIRYDAVSRLLYVCGQENRGVNEAGVWFLRNTNYAMQQRHPGAMLIAEDSTNFLKVTAPVEYGGLGFDYKWDLGWMNDALDYMMKRPDERPGFSREITFSMSYFYNDIFLLPLSHDEVVHGKRTIIDKIYGSYDEKFPQLRLFWLYMFTHPGKKLNFMGNELAEFKEWDENAGLGWNLLSYPKHSVFHLFVTTLQDFYRNHPALYQNDYHPKGFQWMDLTNVGRCLFAYCRDSLEEPNHEKLYIALNFSARPAIGYFLPVREHGTYTEAFNTDKTDFGGDGHHNPAVLSFRQGGHEGIRVDLPAYAGIVFSRKK
ncbi:MULTISPECIES: 1,4-alpha-glucan branching protein GlgB [Caproicibacterium]|nr:1,4-alpha-glucan branching protein GlgB [Caproicibacterium lactatifermentans]MDD4807356.1 1,4-alpha-glucan branching protein GlgB [Oscillospiraceae bacterium]